MCGISGLAAAAPLTGDQRQAVARASGAMIHRGPDGAGAFDAPNVALAARRLAIIDPAGSDQPLRSDDGTLTMVFNGEIYNYHELRRSLSAWGWQFRSDGDGEVVLALYRRDGLDFCRHLRGMFAIALWDADAGRLVLARDRMGEKPLYYRVDGQELLFASELKAMVASGHVPFALDPVAVHLYLHFQFVPEPLSAVAGVRKLAAGHLLIVDVTPWNVREQAYWRLEDAPVLTGDPAILIRDRLEEALSLSLRADVPTGIALSGGLDSSLVAALAMRSATPPSVAITAGYAGRPDSDERRAARALADHLGLDWLEVEIDEAEMVADFPALVIARDDPIADIAGHGYAAVMRRASAAGIKVMLQGQGGDELFWGYAEVRAARRALQRSARSDRWLRRAGLPGRRGLSPYRQSPDFREAHGSVGQLYPTSFAERVRTVDATGWFAVAPSDPFPEVALTERVCAGYLCGNGIAQGDRLGMIASVEQRLPFMDHELVETVVGLRKTASDADLPPKAWLKAATVDLLPPEILARRKRGFEPPVRHWHSALFAAYGATIRGGYLSEAGVLSARGADRAAGGSFPRGANTPLTFKILVLEQWCRQMQSIARQA